MLQTVRQDAHPADSLLEAQKDVLELIIRGQPLQQILNALCLIVEAQSSRQARAAILSVAPDGLHLRTAAAPNLPPAYCQAIDGLAIAPHVGTFAAAVARRQTVTTRDIATDPAWAELRHLPLELGLRAAWSVPIISSTGGVLGTLGTYFTEAREPTAAERRLSEVLAHTAALAIERERADHVLLASARRHRFLAELATATQSLVEPAELMQTSARLLAEHLNVDRCAYAEVENERVFIITGDHSRGVGSIVGRWDVSAFGPACLQSMLAGEAYIVSDSEDEAQLASDYLPAYRATSIRAVICVPLLKQGVFTAAMAVHQATPRRWTDEEIEIVQLVVARCWEALERARVGRTLRDSEARYRVMIEASPEWVKLVAADGTLLQNNAAGLQMLEADAPEQLAGACVYDVVAAAHREHYREFNERVCRGEGGHLAFDIIGLRGGRRSMETTAVPMPAAGGGFVNLAVTRDVTERVAAEQALTQSRSRLDYAVRLSGVGFWYCDLPFEELLWDACVREHFFMPADARVTIDDFYARIHPEDREPTRAAIAASITENRSYDIVYRTVDPASAAVKWIRALGGTTFAADGSPAHFDGVTVDVSPQKQDQERLTSLNEQLREQDRRKDEFLATLAHELRNPLAPIRTGLEILRSGTAEQAGKVRETMERQLGHLVRMVDDLLDISRVTLGKVALIKERVDFRSVLHSALETARPLIEAGAQELAVRLPPDPFPIEVDPTRFAQVLANLLNNSAKYTPAGGRIHLSAAAMDGNLVFRVTDSGIGIPAEMLPRIFDLFTQVGHAEYSQGGLGLGLTLVRRLVEMHGGSIEAESPGIGQGSTFTLRVPLAVPEPVEAPAPHADDGPRGGASLRILVVDDNVDAAETLAMLLGLGGHEVRVASSGEEALDLAATFVPRLAFIDIGLPGINGYEVARRLRQTSSSGSLQLVALTGWGAEEDRRQAQAAGFDLHLVKPVDIDQLNKVIGNLIPDAVVP